LHAYKSDGDPHDEIVRLEAHIEELAAKIESCRKFILASRIAMAGGGIVLAAMFLGAIRIRPRWRPRSRRCSAALSCGVQTAAPQRKRRRNWQRLRQIGQR
jgi:hypothetical protein